MPSSRTAFERSGFMLTASLDLVEADADPTPKIPRTPSTSTRLVPNAMSILRRRRGTNRDSPIPVSCAANFRLCAGTDDSIARRKRRRVTIILSPEKRYQSVIPAEESCISGSIGQDRRPAFFEDSGGRGVASSCESFGKALAEHGAQTWPPTSFRSRSCPDPQLAEWLERVNQRPRPGAGLRTVRSDRSRPAADADSAAGSAGDRLADLAAAGGPPRVTGQGRLSVRPSVIGRRIEVVADLDRVRVFATAGSSPTTAGLGPASKALSNHDHVAAAERLRLGPDEPVPSVTEAEDRSLAYYDTPSAGRLTAGHVMTSRTREPDRP